MDNGTSVLIYENETSLTSSPSVINFDFVSDNGWWGKDSASNANRGTRMFGLTKRQSKDHQQNASCSPWGFLARHMLQLMLRSEAAPKFPLSWSLLGICLLI
jgi:hypothetical protein